jgi:hypothetical protein
MKADNLSTYLRLTMGKEVSKENVTVLLGYFFSSELSNELRKEVDWFVRRE